MSRKFRRYFYHEKLFGKFWFQKSRGRLLGTSISSALRNIPFTFPPPVYFCASCLSLFCFRLFSSTISRAFLFRFFLVLKSSRLVLSLQPLTTPFSQRLNNVGTTSSPVSISKAIFQEAKVTL